ncbi:hypothetical protein KKG45_02465 [bacterium]|nr:hypothetical protein [bacterium]MBU1072086.1 hypothetical protein [bacterium]MBU1676411.1 hypothetical protein [bacterium]
MRRGAAASAAAISLALLLAGTMLSGCSTYVERNRMLRSDLTDGDYDAALKVIDDGAKGHDRLLNLLERGLVLHYADRWRESNEVFEEAELLAADLYTRSISQAAISLITSDGAIDYRAKPYEMVLVPYYRALNYVYLGERGEVLVEARKAEIRLREWMETAAAAGEGGEHDPALDNNAFLHYLRGMLHEWGGETNEAFLAYRHAALAYAAATGDLASETPPWLGADLLRTGTRLGFRAELDELRDRLPGLLPETYAPPEDAGEVVLFMELGYAPHRESRELDLPIFKSDDFDDDYDAWSLTLHSRYRHGWAGRNVEIAYWLRIAVPELRDDPPRVAGARVSSGTVGGQTRTVLVEDVAGRARLRFAADLDGILLKTIARALAKFVAKEKVDDKSKVAGLLANLLGAATERADTRGWLTLPHGIAMARLTLPPGVYDLRVDLVDPLGRSLGEQTIPSVQVRRGGWTFLSRRVF